MSLNELNERDFYEEPGVNIFEKMVDGKKEWIRKSTIDALVVATPDKAIDGIYRKADGSFTRKLPFQHTLLPGAPPVEDAKGLFESNKVEPVVTTSQAMTAGFGAGWVKWVAVGAVALIGMNLLRKKGK